MIASVADRFIALLKTVYESRFSDISKQQPITQASAANRIDALLRKTVNEGGEIVFGGKRDEYNPHRFQPTIFTKAEGTELHTTESFAPFLSISIVDTVDDAIEVANHGDYGLSSAIWTRDYYNALKIARSINAGYATSILRRRLGTNTDIILDTCISTVPLSTMKARCRTEETS